MKSDYSVIIEKLESKLYALGNELLSIEPLLDDGISRLLKLNYIGKLDEKEKDRVSAEDLPEMRDLTSTIYPQKLTCENGSLRTTKLNELVNCIYLINNELDGNKNWISDLKNRLSSKVARPGFEPRQTAPKTVVLPLYYRAISLLGVQI